MAWLEKVSRPVSAFENEAVVCDVLDALAVNLDGAQAAPEYFSRRRRVLHRVLGYAVRKQRLEKNPLSKATCPRAGHRRRHQTTPSTRDVCGSPALITEMLTACSYVGHRQGPRFAAFYGCMYYAMMRPAEVAALTRDDCHLPEHGWGRLTFTDSSTAAVRRSQTTARSTSTAGSKAAPKAGRPVDGGHAGPHGRSPCRRNWSPCCATTSSGTAPARTGAYSAARPGIRSSHRPGGESGRRPERSA